MAASVKELLIKLKADTSGVTAGLDDLKRKINGASGEVVASTKKMSGAFKGVALAVGTMVSVQALNFISDLGREALKTADNFNQLQGKVKGVIPDVSQFNSVMSAIVDSANRSGVSIDAAATSFLRISNAVLRMGYSTDEVVRFNETFSKMGAIAGASSIEVEGSLYQISQGLASGKLQGDELKTVLESMPAVADAIAEAYSKKFGGSVESVRMNLKKLATDGQITPRIVMDAIIAKSKEVDSAFAKLPPSVARSSNEMANNWMKFLGTLDKTTGVTAIVANGLKDVSNALKSASDFVNRNKETFQAWGEAIKIVLGAVKVVFGVFWGYVKYQTEAAVKVTNTLMSTWEKAKKVWASFSEQRRKNTEALSKENGGWFKKGTFAGGAAPIDFQNVANFSGGKQSTAVTDWGATIPFDPQTLIKSKESINQITSEMTELQNVVQNFGQKFEDTFINAAKTGKFEFKALALSILEDLARIYLRLAIINPIVNKLTGAGNKSGGGGIFGFLGGLFKGGGNGPAPVPSMQIRGLAGGGSMSGSRPYIVGERGPEMIIPKTSSSVINNQGTRQMLGGQSVEPVIFNQNFSVGVAQTVRAEMQNMEKQFVASALKAFQADARRNGSMARTIRGAV